MRCPASHSTALTSRWLVGSSSRSRSAFWSMALAIASLILHPPESSLTIFSSIISVVNPTASKHGTTSSTFASSVDACDVMNAKMVCSSVTSTSCCTKTHRMSGGNPLMSPAARRVNSVVLPAPF